MGEARKLLDIRSCFKSLIGGFSTLDLKKNNCTKQ